MTLNEYQMKAQETANYKRPDQFHAVTYCTMGLAGEAGEAAKSRNRCSTVTTP